ncbi:MAG TPA: hypothetical protein VLM89_05775 [Phycisphaerae bacterium]|nr:hypothetical protein [Phycisphaerae bacterium]
MDVINQAAFVLKVIVALAPLSLYFLLLGLVSSRARPHLVSARADFAILAMVFIPVIGLPLVAMIGRGQHHIVTGVVVVLLATFFALLPRRDRSWVLYNCSPSQGRRLLLQAARRLRWQVTRHDDDSLEIRSAQLRITHAALPWLRNVTLHTDGPLTAQGRADRHTLMAALSEELQHEQMLPSATGAGLVLLGAALLGLPMWYFLHNISTIVEAVRRILSA